MKAHLDQEWTDCSLKKKDSYEFEIQKEILYSHSGITDKSKH
jgi:hypothetical protein